MQASIGMQYNNLFGRYENIYLQFVTTPPLDNRGLDYSTLSYREKCRFGTELGIRGSVSASNLGFDLSEFDI